VILDLPQSLFDPSDSVAIDYDNASFHLARTLMHPTPLGQQSWDSDLRGLRSIKHHASDRSIDFVKRSRELESLIPETPSESNPGLLLF